MMNDLRVIHGDCREKLVEIESGSIETVLDPFMGSGTSLVAARVLGLPAIGIEISRKDCDSAIERLRQNVFNFEEAV